MAVRNRSMVELEEVALEGFRGGLAARRSPLDFGEEQWAKLHGWVVEDGGVLRSQWPLQKIGALANIASFGVYQGPSETPFLIAVTDAGDVYWREAPSDGVTWNDASLSTAWTQLQDESNTNVAATSSHRPIVTVPVDSEHLSEASGGLRPAMILNSIHIGDGDSVWFVYEKDSGGLTAMEFDHAQNKWPEDDETEVSPKGEFGTVWNGVLVLGDIEWKADTDAALSNTNKTRYTNGLWLSVPGEVLLFDPLSVLFIGDSNTRISGLLPTEQGLLVFSTSQKGVGGVHILRGTPDAFTLEPLHVGIGVTSGQTHWPDTNTWTWVTTAGEVWQTDTDQVRRLDRQGLGVDRQTSARDGVRSFGPWLVVVRERRMFCLRALDDGRTAAWTELNIDSLPGPPDMSLADESGQALYFMSDGEIFRFTRADTETGVSERGLDQDGTQLELAVGSRTLSTGEGHHKTYWHRVGIRATAGRRATNSSVERLVLRAGPVLDNVAPSLTRVVQQPLQNDEGDLEGTQFEKVTWDGQVATWDGADMAWSIVGAELLPLPTHSPKRWQAIVRGVGTTNEFSIEAVLKGDVQMEQVSVFFQGSILGGDEEGR